MQHSGPFFCVLSSGEAQNSLQPGTALSKVLAHVPESKKSNAQAQTPLQIAIFKKPIERVTEIVDLNIALRQPAIPVRGIQFRIPLFRENQTIRRM